MTRDIFNQIAPSWYNFRHWSIFTKELEVLTRRWQQGKLLNLGCAHGADFLPFKQSFELYGVDFSSEMTKYAQKYALKFNFEVKLEVADVSYLPYPDEAFDWAISIATYHHIKGESERQKALGELKRVLKPGGEAFITVWNRYQPKFWFSSKEVAVPWRQRSKVLQRYYHLFSYSELERLVKKTGFRVLESFPENSYHFPLKAFSKNICLLAQESD